MKQAVLGIDLGLARIGVAICEQPGLPAVPLQVMKHRSWSADADAIIKLAQSRNANTIVVGVPLLMDGSPGTQAQRAFAFIETLQKRFSGSVIAQDERFTTAVADQKLRALPISGSKRRKHRDELAAVEILNTYLSSHGRSCAT